jgi:hypothetical protein
LISCSDTNYRVFADVFGVPGIDFAFYEGRTFYHTPGDHFDRVSVTQIQRLGENLLSIALPLSREYDILASEVFEQIPVYFDLPSMGGVFWTRNFAVLLGILMVSIAVAIQAWGWYESKLMWSDTTARLVINISWNNILLFLAVALGIVTAFVFGFLISFYNAPIVAGFPLAFSLTIVLSSTIVGTDSFVLGCHV